MAEAGEVEGGFLTVFGPCRSGFSRELCRDAGSQAKSSRLKPLLQEPGHWPWRVSAARRTRPSPSGSASTPRSSRARRSARYATPPCAPPPVPPAPSAARSEEHTSELQSLMRISYAVFCLKKNTQLFH